MVVPFTFTSIPGPFLVGFRSGEVAWVVLVVTCFVRGFVVGRGVGTVVAPGCRSVARGGYTALLPLLDSFT